MTAKLKPINLGAQYPVYIDNSLHWLLKWKYKNKIRHYQRLIKEIK